MTWAGARYGSVLALALGLAASAFSLTVPAHALDLLTEALEVPVTIRQIDHFRGSQPQKIFGKLEFLGGIEVISSDRNIGGLSGVASLDDGNRILAVSDNGNWFTAEVKQDENGKPLGLENARYASMLGKDGKTLRASWGHDTEALAIGDDSVLVSAERVNKIYRFPWPLTTGKERMLGELKLSQEMRHLRGTKGMEAMAIAPAGTPLAGTVIAIAERGPTDDADMPGFLIRNGKIEKLTIEKTDRYDATDAAFLPRGDLLLLERRFNLRDLVGMRIRRFFAENIKPGAKLTGEVLMEADYSYQIDNMEGLGLHQDAQGRTILTLISDNNRSILQRTLLLRFLYDDN